VPVERVHAGGGGGVMADILFRVFVVLFGLVVIAKFLGVGG
jgi:hypothetical protein